MNVAGKKIPPWALWGGGIGAALAGWVYLKNRGKAAAAGPGGPAAGTVTDPSTGQSYPAGGTDPATGLTYSAEIAQYGSVAAADSSAQSSSGYGASGESPYYGTAGYPAGGGGGSSGGGTGSYDSNAQWAQSVQAGLAALGYNPETIGAALGLYLNSMPLPAADVPIVQTAVAEYGPPPVGSYHIIGSGNGSGSGGATVPVPNVTGLSQEQAFEVLASEGLKSRGSRVEKGKTLTVDSQSPKAGTHVAAGSTVTLSSTVHKPPKRG